jgi:hypothetical protein
LDALLPNPSLQQTIGQIEQEQIEEIPLDPTLLYGLPNPTAPGVPLSETKEEEGSLGGEDEVIEQVDVGSENAGSIAGDILDTDADFVSFPWV